MSTLKSETSEKQKDSISTKSWEEKHGWWNYPFLRFWTKAVGTEDYDKEEWKEFERILYKLAGVNQ